MGVLLMAPARAGSQVAQEPPPVEVTESTILVAIEVEEERDGDNTRFDYTVRYLSTTADGAGLVQFEIGAPWISGTRITERPLALEGPPGWTATAIPDNRSNPTTWRLSWSCAHSGWDHRLKHQIRPGQVVRGFRAWAPRGVVGYATAPYRLYLDLDRGVPLRGALGTSGRVTQKRK